MYQFGKKVLWKKIYFRESFKNERILERDYKEFERERAESFLEVYNGRIFVPGQNSLVGFSCS